MEQPQLPDLKKKDKERKKAGAMWNGFGNGSSPFQGAAGGAAARSSASIAAQAAGAAGAAGARGILLSTLFAGKFGTMLAVALIFGVGILASYAMLFGRNRAQNVASAPSLGALESTITVERPQTSRALDWLARSAQGELKFDPTQKAPATEKKVETAENTATAPSEATDWNGVLTNERPMTDRMAHDLSGAKLSSQLGGNFGGKNVFASADAPKFGGMAGNAGKFDSMGNGKSSAMRNNRAASGKRATNQRSRSPRAIGQLKFARQLSNRANLATSDDAARTRATDAFDGKVTTGDDKPALITPIADGVPSINPGPNSGTSTPPDAGHKNETPYQGELEQARKEAEQAGQMQMMGLAMLALGAALAIIAGAMQQPVGMGLIIAGIALMAAGAMMLMMAMQQKKSADNRADKVAEQEGQTEHGKSTKDCINEAYGNGGKSNDSCSGSGKTYLNGTHVQKAVKEESNSTYQLENGQPISN